MIKAYILEGKELSKIDLDTINKYRILKFQSKSVIDPKPANENWHKKYFLVKDQQGNVFSFGRLHDIKVELCKQKFNILGIATIVSIVEGAGYGKMLMLKMKDYIQNTGKTGVGFCAKKTSGFYKKCGFEIIEDQEKRFIYINENGEHIKTPHEQGDVILFKGKDNFYELFIDNPVKMVYTNRPHW